MERIPEQELMDEAAQALAYAGADFEQPHSMFIDLFCETFDTVAHGVHVLDLGCGPGDITFRFARTFAGCRMHGIDGSEAMLRLAEEVLDNEPSLQGRVRFSRVVLPDEGLSRAVYDCIISNSLLHHLPDPSVLWQTVKTCAVPGAPVFIMDLKRPVTMDEAARLRDMYAEGEPEVLRRDFYNSLLAAFEPGEIRSQLRDASLGCLSVRSVSDRHLTVSGHMPG
jgi:SAM-dependent methyltransferase